MTTHLVHSSAYLCGRPQRGVAENEYRANCCRDALSADGGLVGTVPERLHDLVPDQIVHVLGDVIDADRAIRKKISGGRSRVHTRNHMDLQRVPQAPPHSGLDRASELD